MLMTLSSQTRKISFQIPAIQFFRAYQIVKLGNDEVLLPKHYLLIHAIEALLKAILAANGQKVSRIRKLNHNLTKIVNEIDNFELRIECSSDDRRELELATILQKDKELNYLNPKRYLIGASQLPDLSILEKFFEKNYRAIA